MARKKAEKDELVGKIEAAIPEPDDGLDVTAGEDTPDLTTELTYPPQPTDVGWQEYVLKQFHPSEVDPDGNPFADAARRVTELLLGTIVGEIPRTVQTPDSTNGYRGAVEVVVSIAWGGDRNDIRSFGDVADVYAGNTDPQFARHALATAKTKAAGRAYKAALKLKRVYTVEEMTEVAVSEAGLDKFIVPSQQVFIDRECRALDVNVMKFINSGELQYNHITHIRYERAQSMIERLMQYKRKEMAVPEEVRGYDPNWKRSANKG